ncbi:unnamed protein product [Boreogadus saida]
MDQEEEEESQARRPPAGGKLSEADPSRKGKAAMPSMVFNRLFPEIKEEPGHPTMVHPSYYLYTYDKMVAPNVSLQREAEMSAEMLGTLLKQHYSRRGPAHDEPPMDLHASPPDAEEAKSQHPAAERERLAQAVSMETGSLARKKAAHTPTHCSPCSPPPPLPSTPLALSSSTATAAVLTSPSSPPPPATEASAKDGASAVVEDDKDRIVVEIMQMYSRQQEKLHSTLHKQFQLEMYYLAQGPESHGGPRDAGGPRALTLCT